MNQKKIGHYYFGHESVEIVIREGTGGEFWVTPELGHIPRIKIGIDQDEWLNVLGVLLHEAFEFAFERLKCRYFPWADDSRDHAAYLFVIPHTEFSDACTKVAAFIFACLPDLKKEWDQWRKNKEKKNERTNYY